MQTFENFVLTDKQKEMFLKSIYNRRYAKYIKENGTNPIITDDFYNYTKEDLEKYKRAIFSTTLDEQPVVSDFEKNLVDEVKEDVVFRPSSSDEAVRKFADYDDIIISTDMELSNPLYTGGFDSSCTPSTSDKVLTVDGNLSIKNGKTLINNDELNHFNLYIKGNGTLSNLSTNGKYVVGQWVENTKTVILGGKFESQAEKKVESGTPYTEVIYAFKGLVEIYGGTFRVISDKTTKEQLEMVAKFMLNCKDDSYANGTAKIKVYGGEFWDFNPAESHSENPTANFVAEGYKSVSKLVSENGVEHTVWTVMPE